MTLPDPNSPFPHIDLHFRVLCGDSDLPPHAESEADVEVADAAKVFHFLRPELQRRGQIWPQGILAITVNGEPWNGGYDNYGKMAPRVRYFCCRDFSCEVDWLREVTALLEGDLHATLMQDDDETPPSITRTRQNHLRIGYAGQDDDPVLTDLLHFATLLSDAGESLLRFSYRLLGECYAQLAMPGLAPQETKGIEQFIHYLGALEIKGLLAALRKAIEQFGQKPSLKHAWNDVLDLMRDHPAYVTLEPLPAAGPQGVVVLHWDHLPVSEHRYLLAYAHHTQASKKVTWQNPFQSRPLAHILESLEVDGEEVTLRLRTNLGKSNNS